MALAPKTWSKGGPQKNERWDLHVLGQLVVPNHILDAVAMDKSHHQSRSWRLQLHLQMLPGARVTLQRPVLLALKKLPGKSKDG